MKGEEQLADQWDLISEGLRKDVKRVFERTTSFSFPYTFEEGIAVFRGTLVKELGIQDLDDRRDILRCLEDRYVNRKLDFDDLGKTLTSMAMKVESFLKRVFIIAKGTRNNGQFAACLKEFLRDHGFLSQTDRDKFFDKNNPVNPEYFASKMPFGEHMKKVYNIRNLEGHLDPELEDDELLSIIKSIVIVYLFITFSYYERLKEKVTVQLGADDFTVNWSDFYSKCNNFDPNYHYILITGPNVNLSSEQLSHFSNINWSFVFDFDVYSEQRGLLAAAKTKLEHAKAIQQIVNGIGTGSVTFPLNTVFWFSAAGNLSIRESMPTRNSIFSWKEKYSEYIRKLMSDFHQQIPKKPVSIIILYDIQPHIEEVLQAIKLAFGEKVNIIFSTQRNSSLSSLISDEELNAEQCDITFAQICEGFRILQGHMLQVGSTDNVYLPCHPAKGGKSIEIDSVLLQKIRQYFYVVHLNVTNDPIKEEVSTRSFYQGRVISWSELEDGGYDVKREITEDIEEELRRWLENRSTGGIVTLYHYPGAGATTIARKIALNFYRKFPTVILEDYDKVKTVEALHKIFERTEQPILVIVDNKVSATQVKELSEQTEHRIIKCVFLFVEGHFENKKGFYLPLRILPEEENRFKKKFEDHFPLKKDQFKKIFEVRNSNEMTPFFFGLTAFEEKYISLSDYVRLRLSDITDQQKQLLAYIALCSFYGKGEHTNIPSYLFMELLKVPEDYCILQHWVPRKMLDLIIETESLYWRALHPVIAKELLNQLLGVNSSNQINPYKLADLCKSFIGLTRGVSTRKIDEVLGLLTNLFIFRNSNVEEIPEDESVEGNGGVKKGFSTCIYDLASNSLRIEVLESLTDNFPTEEPHFWAHLSRVYSHDGRYPQAHDAIDKGLSLLKNDESRRDYFILQHIKGICYRAEAYAISDKYYGQECPEEEMLRFKELFEFAEKHFLETRILAPQREHGYISYIQFVVKAIEFGRSISDKGKVGGFTSFLTHSSSEWYVRILNEAGEMLEQIKEKSNGRYSPYSKKMELRLLKFYDEHDQLINSWRLLLGNRSFNPIVIRRQIVNAYLAKSEFDWDRLKISHLNQVEELLFQNIKSQADDRDIRLWFKVARRLNFNEERIIRVLEQREFLQENLESAFYLHCLYSIKALGGATSAIKLANEYRVKCQDRVKIPVSKVFCREWVGKKSGRIQLVNHSEVGIWEPQLNFFKEDKPNFLERLRGKVKRYKDRSQGFIELEGCGLEALYVPGSVNHYSDNEGDNVDFYLGINYFGLRAFKVRNI